MKNKKLFMHKRLSFFCLLLFFFSSLHVQAQNQFQRITFFFSDIPLSEAIKKIESISEYTFFYDVNKTDITQSVSLDVKETAIEEAINQLLKSTDLTCSITNRQIALHPKTVSNLTSGLIVVAGMVVDETGEPVIGANVLENGKRQA
jgi:type II secretory pathway component GspD/PulD (secretin)